MKSIEYRISYSGTIHPKGGVTSDPTTEVVSVQARDINSGYAKALKRAREPLGNGLVREIGIVEFWRIA